MTSVFENINLKMENLFESFVFVDPKYCYDGHEAKTQRKNIPVDRASVKSKHGNETLTLALQGITFSYHNNNNNG